MSNFASIVPPVVVTSVYVDGMNSNKGRYKTGHRNQLGKHQIYREAEKRGEDGFIRKLRSCPTSNRTETVISKQWIYLHLPLRNNQQRNQHALVC